MHRTQQRHWHLEFRKEQSAFLAFLVNDKITDARNLPDKGHNRARQERKQKRNVSSKQSAKVE